jgi:hypothetical protein
MGGPQHGTKARYKAGCRCKRCEWGQEYREWIEPPEVAKRDWQRHDDKIDTILEILAGR